MGEKKKDENSTPRTLEEWRLSRDEEEWVWRDSWQASVEQRKEERTRRRRELARRDRKMFGPELWGVSEKHFQAKAQVRKLLKYHLPELKSEAQLANWLGISLKRLRWFTHDKSADTVWHYVRYVIPKRSGGERVILAPKKELKAIQRQILHDLIYKVPVSGYAHGFTPGRSMVSNARPHVGKAFVLNMDLKDFFPSITFDRVRGLFLSWGYAFSIASVLALLCTEYDREAYQWDEDMHHVSLGKRHLIQGAPTSPALANRVAWKLDRRLAGLAKKMNFSYTRYADDITFSGDNLDDTLRILDVAQRIIGDEGFQVNKRKTRIFRQFSRQMVTGIVVNEKTATPRQLRRRVRAILHQGEHTGLNAQNYDNRDNFRAYLQGLIGFIHEANPEQGQILMDKLKTVAD